MLVNENSHFDKKNKFFSKEFWNACAVKLTTTLLSVKVWGLFICFTVPTILLVQGHIESSDWVKGFTVVPSVIYGMREIFKISAIWDHIKQKGKEENNNEDEDE